MIRVYGREIVPAYPLRAQKKQGKEASQGLIVGDVGHRTFLDSPLVAFAYLGERGRWPQTLVRLGPTRKFFYNSLNGSLCVCLPCLAMCLQDWTMEPGIQQKRCQALSLYLVQPRLG